MATLTRSFKREVSKPILRSGPHDGKNTSCPFQRVLERKNKRRKITTTNHRRNNPSRGNPSLTLPTPSVLTAVLKMAHRRPVITCSFFQSGIFFYRFEFPPGLILPPYFPSFIPSPPPPPLFRFSLTRGWIQRERKRSIFYILQGDGKTFSVS